MALSRIFTTEIAESALATRNNTALRTSTLGTASGIDALRTSTLAKELSQRLIHQVSEGPDGAGAEEWHAVRMVESRGQLAVFSAFGSFYVGDIDQVKRTLETGEVRARRVKLSRHPFERGSMRRVKRRAAAGTFRPWCSLRDK